MVYTQRVQGNFTVTASMSFAYQMAPLIVLAPELSENAQGQKEYAEHFEIIIFNEGVNVWQHFVKAGKLTYRKAAFASFPLAKDTPYTLEVKKLGKVLTVSVAGHVFGSNSVSPPAEPEAYRLSYKAVAQSVPPRRNRQFLPQHHECLNVAVVRLPLLCHLAFHVPAVDFENIPDCEGAGNFFGRQSQALAPLAQFADLLVRLRLDLAIGAEGLHAPLAIGAVGDSVKGVRILFAVDGDLGLAMTDDFGEPHGFAFRFVWNLCGKPHSSHFP
jgi:hypothetical protein